jgi:hypothetical protein
MWVLTTVCHEVFNEIFLKEEDAQKAMREDWELTVKEQEFSLFETELYRDQEGKVVYGLYKDVDFYIGPRGAVLNGDNAVEWYIREAEVR